MDKNQLSLPCTAGAGCFTREKYTSEFVKQAAWVPYSESQCSDEGQDSGENLYEPLPETIEMSAAKAGGHMIKMAAAAAARFRGGGLIPAKSVAAEINRRATELEGQCLSAGNEDPDGVDRIKGEVKNLRGQQKLVQDKARKGITQFAAPLFGEPWHQSLGCSLRQRAFPHPVRTMDPVVVASVSNAHEQRSVRLDPAKGKAPLDRDHNYKRMRIQDLEASFYQKAVLQNPEGDEALASVVSKAETRQLLVDTLFGAAVLRLTGRTACYQSWADSKRGDKCLLPRIDEAGDFTLFLRKCNSRRCPVARWFSGQHKSAIPSSIFRSVKALGNTVMALADKAELLGEIVDLMLDAPEGEEGEGQRMRAIKQLQATVESACPVVKSGRSTDKMSWLSAIILADMEEAYEGLFMGDTLGAFLGVGSKMGMSVIREANRAQMKDGVVQEGPMLRWYREECWIGRQVNVNTRII